MHLHDEGVMSCLLGPAVGKFISHLLKWQILSEEDFAHTPAGIFHCLYCTSLDLLILGSLEPTPCEKLYKMQVSNCKL